MNPLLIPGSALSMMSHRRRDRSIYTPEQITELEENFKICHFLTGTRKTELADQLGLSEKQVKIWFQNRRMKHKKEGKEVMPDPNLNLLPGAHPGGFAGHMAEEVFGRKPDVKQELVLGGAPVMADPRLRHMRRGEHSGSQSGSESN